MVNTHTTIKIKQTKAILLNKLRKTEKILDWYFYSLKPFLEDTIITNLMGKIEKKQFKK
jgi:hypothetical protein